MVNNLTLQLANFIAMTSLSFSRKAGSIRGYALVAFSLLIFLLICCSKGNSPLAEVKKSSEKTLLTFGFSNADNANLTEEVKGSIAGTVITVSLPETAILTALKATFTSSPKSVVKVGSAVQADRSTVNDFSAPVIYTVVAEDGSQQNYTVTVKLSSKAILSFGFLKADNGSLTEDCMGLINGTNIGVLVSSTADLASLKAVFTASSKAIVKVGDVVQQSKTTINNFGMAVVYSVFADDGSKQDYTITVVKKSAEKSILTFGLNKADHPFLPSNVVGVITDRNISVVVPYNTDLSGLKPYFTISPKAVIKVGTSEQQSGKSANNFNMPVTYAVTAEDGSFVNYTVTVSWAANTAKKLNSFEFLRSLNSSLPYDVKGVVDSLNRKVVCIVPPGIVRTNLIASFSLSDKAIAKVGTVNQVSGNTPNNFTAQLIFSVIAQDGSTSDYTIELQNEIPPVISQSRIDAKVLALNLHIFPWGQPNRFPGINVVPVVSTTFLSQRPASSMPFDAGYIGNDGKVYVTAPFTTEQKAIFRDATDVALFYVCQAFLQHYYNATQMPIWFKYGMAAFEADLKISDNDVKTAIQQYGGQLPSLAALNDPVKFASSNGINIAYMWGEFMAINKTWNYYDIINVNSQTIEVAPYWSVAPLSNMYAIWSRYINYRILETNDAKRGRMLRKTDHFRYYSAPKDSFCIQGFEDVLSKAYVEYTTELNISFPERINVGFGPECEGALIDGIACSGRYTGGTGWVSGLAVSSPNTLADLSLWHHLMRHEFAHTVVFRLYPYGYQPTAWFSEGAAEFLTYGPMSQARINEVKGQVKEAMQKATGSFGHRPTYDDTKIYPNNPYYDYYLLGQTLMNFIFQNGGYEGVKNVLSNAEEGIKSLGFANHDEFMKGYYEYYDKVWNN